VNYTISRYSARRLKNDFCDRMRIKFSGIHDFIRNNENRPLYGTFLASLVIDLSNGWMDSDRDSPFCPLEIWRNDSYLK